VVYRTCMRLTKSGCRVEDKKEGARDMYRWDCEGVRMLQ
jgi:hypothetical protein